MVSHNILMSLLQNQAEQLANTTEAIKASMESTVTAVQHDLDVNVGNTSNRASTAEHGQITEANRLSARKSRRESAILSRPKVCCAQKGKDILIGTMKREVDMLEFHKPHSIAVINTESLIQMEACLQVMSCGVAHMRSKLSTIRTFISSKPNNEKIQSIDMKGMVANLLMNIHLSIQCSSKFSYHSSLITSQPAFENSVFKNVNDGTRRQEKILSGKRIVHTGDAKQFFSLTTEEMLFQKSGNDIIFRGKGVLETAKNDEQVDQNVERVLSKDHSRSSLHFLERKIPEKRGKSGNRKQKKQARPMDEDPTDSNRSDNRVFDENNNNGETRSAVSRPLKSYDSDFVQRRTPFSNRLASLHFYKISKDMDTNSDDFQPSCNISESEVASKVLPSQTVLRHRRRTRFPIDLDKHLLQLPVPQDGDKPQRKVSSIPRVPQNKSKLENLELPQFHIESDSESYHTCTDTSDTECAAGSHDSRPVVGRGLQTHQEPHASGKQRTLSSGNKERLPIRRKSERQMNKCGESWGDCGTTVEKRRQQCLDEKRPSDVAEVRSRSKAMSEITRKLDEATFNISLLAAAYIKLRKRLEMIEGRETSFSLHGQEAESKPNVVPFKTYANNSSTDHCNVTAKARAEKKRFFKFSK